MRLTGKIAPDKIGLALTPGDARTIAASRRKVEFIGVENAYPLGTDLSRIKEFDDRDGKWMHHGLSDLGKEAIVEMNRVGFMIDLSHPSKQSNLQAIALSKAPVIASHSAARAPANHSRNLDDEELAAIEKNGGGVQTVAFDGYVKIEPPDPPERARALVEGGPAHRGGIAEGEVGVRLRQGVGGHVVDGRIRHA